ncbi:nitric oxide reductase activation protein NorD [Cupriavidus plantarum]|uniref:nitric oxide reductase activation protein NorD n=2 Tax=Cupriavidus plantarum TaxID=942865 RepID=UPI00339D6632
MTAPDVSASLDPLLTGLAGSGMTVATAPRLRRPVLTTTHLLIPALDTYTASYATQRAVVAHAAAHLRYSPRAQPSRGLKPLSVAVIAAIEDARVDSLMLRDCPGVRAWLLPALREAADPHGLSFRAMMSRLGAALLDDDWPDDNYWVDKARRGFAALRTRLHDYAAFREMASILANDLGQMRVRFDANDYAVPALYRDDNSFLWDHDPSTPPPDADPLTLAATSGYQRSDRDDDADERDESIAEVPRPAQTNELSRTAYPEWDYRLELARQDWCTVIERPPAAQAIMHAAAAQSDLQRLGSRLALPHRQRLSRDRRLRRQLEGESLDLDAAVTVMIDRRLGLAPEPRLFLRPARGTPHFSILLLVDASASTNDPVTGIGGGTTVLDVERTATAMLAHAAAECGHRVAIHAFSSDTREAVNYYRLLDFGDRLDGSARTRLGALAGRFSTRIGAALRHATTCVMDEPNPHRAIVIVTDGEPSDVDVFDRRYLAEDARAAAQAARRAGVAVCGVTIDAGAAPYIRTILGHGNFCIADTARALPAQLSAIYARLVSN